MVSNGWLRNEIKEIIFYLFLLVFSLVLLPLFGGFILSGFSESFQSGTISLTTYLGSFIVYFFLMIGALLLPIYSIGRLIAIPKGVHPAKQKNPNWFTFFTVNLIHSPEENGALYKLFNYLGFNDKNNPMRWSLSIIRCIAIGIIVFGLLGIFQLSYSQLIFAGVPQPPQQLTVTSDIIFGSFVPAFSENGVLLILFCFLLGVDAYFCSKYKLGLGTFFTIGFILCIICGIVWQQLHHIIYSTSDVKSFATFIFGTLGLAITLLTGTFIFFFEWHLFNNMFIKIAELSVTNESIRIIAIALWLLFTISYIAIEIWRYNFKKKRKKLAENQSF